MLARRRGRMNGLQHFVVSVQGGQWRGDCASAPAAHLISWELSRWLSAASRKSTYSR